MSASVAALEKLDRAAFTIALGEIFEHSPWIAEAAWEKRPFGDLAELHRSMVAAMRSAGRERQLALIRAHPELAGGAKLTAASEREQGSAGLADAAAAERARFKELNVRYRERFGFPFVIAVGGRSKAEILAAFEARLANTPEAEFARALDEIAEIARLRLTRMLAP
jgi:2-oxo-4-hydroxy-4-carboxy-5-ureidoimidazoline decarboxylase